ncbi:MAG TPA: HmuY family protein [Spirochaetia bacterium]
MKQRIYVACAAALALAALAFVGCEQTLPTDGSAEYTFDGTKVAPASGSTTYNYLYVNLDDPGNPLSAGNNTQWDLMITAAKEILTNSGVTATSLSSGGQGGVVFSGSTDFSHTISVSDAAALFAADVASGVKTGDGADYSYWDKYQTGSATPTTPQTGNAISFPGYPSSVSGRDGTTAATAWVFGAVGAHVDVDFSLGTAYARWERMNPSFSNFTNNVYVVRSGDGASYYKIQVLEATYMTQSNTPSTGDTTTHYTYKIKIQKIS